MHAMMMGVWKQILAFLTRHSYFISPGYYGNLLHTYFSFRGFLVGLITISLTYGASVGTEKKKAFFKTIAVVALINSCSTLWKILAVFSRQDSFTTGLDHFLATENLISGLLATLVIVSCYRRNHSASFCFGLVTYGTDLFLYQVFGMGLSSTVFWYVILRVLFFGLLCRFISDRKYFYTGFALYSIYYIVSKAIFLYLQQAHTGGKLKFSLGAVFSCASHYTLEFVVMACVLTISILYERLVLKVQMPANAAP